jgi:tRNA threonylcarbamoyladenosine biosynthesis protein TsaB
MLILAVDTSGKDGSVALVKCGGDGCRTLQVVSIEGGTFSAQLIPQISSLLRQLQLERTQIDAFVAVSGPGSFTGLRVGLAAIKALAEILQKPIAAISLLEVIARTCGLQGNVLAASDAGRGEFFCAAYEVESSRLRLIWQDLLTPDELLVRSQDFAVVSPDAKVAGLLTKTRSRLIQVARPRADEVARPGYEKILRGEITFPEALDANYVRRSDAELKSPAGSFKA